jgi:Ca2+-binding RTX toxin-like protein
LVQSSTSSSATSEVAPLLTQVVDDVAPDAPGYTTSYTGNWMINDPTPALTVSLAGTNAAAGDTLKLASKQPTVVEFDHTVTSAEVQAGYVTLTPTLADGWYQFAAQLVHADGTSVGASSVRGVREDTVAPVAPQITTVHDDAGATTGDLASGATTDDTTPTVTVTFDLEQPATSGSPGHNPYPTSSTIQGTVQLFANGVLVGSTMAQAGPATITTSALAPGSYQLTSRVIDTSGNVGALSQAFSLTVAQSNDTAQGQVLTAHQSPDTLSGGAGADTITASQGPDQLTGGAGSDSFVFAATPWNAGHITDFAVGSDRLDLSALFHASGYTGSTPIQDGYVRLESDGNGGTEVLYDTDGFGSGNTIWFRITDLDHVSPTGLTWAQLTGSAPAATSAGDTASGGGTTAGQALTAHQAPDTLSGGAGADTITASQGADQLSGGGGADLFVFNATPWNAGHITDFTVGVDHLDLSKLMQASGYTGSDPVADGYVSLVSDGAGGTEVLYDTDGRASGNTIQFRITDLDNVSPTGLTWAQLSVSGTSAAGSSPPENTSGTTGQVLTSQHPGDTLTGGAGADTLNASQGPDQLTGGGGADHFVFQNLPWNSGHITDFTPGSDVLDLRPLFAASAYAGSDPIADHWLEFRADGAGNTQVYFDSDGPSGREWPTFVTTLDHVTPSQITAGDFLFH